MSIEQEYKCGIYSFIFCMSFSDKIFYGHKKKEFHPHPLVKNHLAKTEIEEGKNELMKQNNLCK